MTNQTIKLSEDVSDNIHSFGWDSNESETKAEVAQGLLIRLRALLATNVTLSQHLQII